MIVFCENLTNDFTWLTLMGAVLPFLALLLSGYTLYKNVAIAERNTRLTIQQALMKTVAEKVSDCNQLWDVIANKAESNLPHKEVVSELIISIEVIERSLSLFEKSYKLIWIEARTDYYYLFWKQLRPYLRKWIRDSSWVIMEHLADDYYTDDIKRLHKEFREYFDPVK